MDTDDGNKLYRWSGSAWVSYAQLSALWANVSGTGTPEDNATVGAQIGSDFLDVDGNLTVMDYYNADTIYENIPVHTLDIVNKSVGSGGVIGLSVATGSLYLATPSSGYAYATRYVTDARNTWAKKRGFSAELRINGTTTGFFGSSEFYLGHDVSYGYMGLYLGVNSSSQATWNYIFNVGATETYQGSIMGGNTYDMDGTPAGDKTFRIAAVWDPVANTASYSVTDGTDLYTFQKTGLTNNPPDNSHHYRMHADIGGSVWCGVPKWGFFQEV